jgi:outer membrane protein assembly factor BamB
MLLLLSLGLHATTSILAPRQAGDWPCFGGPSRTSQIAALEARFDWGEKGPEVLWRTTTGPGFGGAAVHGGEVFLLDCVLGESDVLRAFDLESGAERWSAAYEAKGRVQFPGSRSVPAVTADAVHASGPLGHVTCFDRQSREIRWQEHLGETYGGEQPMFGWSGSPLLVGELVVHTALGPEVGLVALEQETGAERWVSATVGYSHSTPALLTLHGKPQIVFLSTSYQTSGQDQAAPTTVSSFDPASGERLWQHTLTLTRLPVAPPVQVDEERLFLTGGYRGGSTLLRVSVKDGAYAFQELFHVERGAQVHAPLLHGGCLYLLANENWNEPRNRRAEGGLLCLGLDGKERWRTGEDPYFGRGHALLAGAHLLIQDGYDGTLRVVRARPERYELVAEARPFAENGARDGQMWAPMALSGNRLLLRSQEELLCIRL